jgi:D-3-phosphoglycerate dehydrogenase
LPELTAGHELSGKTLGIVGFGNVGKTLAGICHSGLAMNVLAANRSLIPSTPRVMQRDLGELVTQSDCVVLTCPLTEQTRGLINAARTARMKHGACLINVARAPVLDEQALLRALQTGHLGGAGLDVFETQPLPVNHPFYKLDNVVLTPNVAGISDESMQRMGLGGANAVASILRGARPDVWAIPKHGKHLHPASLPRSTSYLQALVVILALLMAWVRRTLENVLPYVPR